MEMEEMDRTWVVGAQAQQRQRVRLHDLCRLRWLGLSRHHCHRSCLRRCRRRRHRRRRHCSRRHRRRCRRCQQVSRSCSRVLIILHPQQLLWRCGFLSCALTSCARMHVASAAILRGDHACLTILSTGRLRPPSARQSAASNAPPRAKQRERMHAARRAAGQEQ